VTVDVRANIICNLGTVLSGQVGDTLLTDGGLITTTGSLELEGIVLPARGTEVVLAYHRPQTNTITRFPRRLRVLRAKADPLRGKSAVEIGCLLALQQSNGSSTDVFPAPVTTIATSTQPAAFAETYPPVSAQQVLMYCLTKVGIALAADSRALTFSFLNRQFEFDSGYLSVVNELIKSESCYAVLTAAEQLRIAKVTLTAATSAPVLTAEGLIDLQPIQGGNDPGDQALVTYRSVGG
jgi:hypothetical protein